MLNDGLTGISENIASSVELQLLYSITKFTSSYFFNIGICDGVIFLFQGEIDFKMLGVVLHSVLHIESFWNLTASTAGNYFFLLDLLSSFGNVRPHVT